MTGDARQHLPLGFTFRETMGGFIADGAGDCREAEVLGRRLGDQLRFRVRITIDDLARFIGDPAHAARLTGTVEAPRFGGTMPIDDGTLNLFIEDERGRKEMRYRISFQARDGRRYRLEGRKEIHNDRVVDVWSDTTTLFTTVRHEDGEEEPIVATGVLRIGLLDLVPQVASMRALHARGRGDQARALTRFGRFFFGHLWGEYARFTARPLAGRGRA